MLFVISTAGLPVAISKNGVGKLARWGTMPSPGRFSAWRSARLYGGWGHVLAFDASGRRYYAEHILVKTPEPYYAILAISPPSLFVAVNQPPSAVFPGESNMYPTARFDR
jgi:hypothetical protein